MFAIVRTGGKQYRVAAGDKIAVDRMAGEAGDSVSLGEALFASDAGEPKSGLTVSAEIVAQAKADKIIVFKKKRRHNYRRKAGHRQQHTILKILSVGDAPKAAKAKKESAPAEDKTVVNAAPVVETTSPPATSLQAPAEVVGEAAPGVIDVTPAAEAKPAKKAKTSTNAATDTPEAPATKPTAKKRAE